MTVASITYTHFVLYDIHFANIKANNSMLVMHLNVTGLYHLHHSAHVDEASRSRVYLVYVRRYHYTLSPHTAHMMTALITPSYKSPSTVEIAIYCHFQIDASMKQIKREQDKRSTNGRPLAASSRDELM